MGRIAVDIVLLPDEAMTNRAIELNSELVLLRRRLTAENAKHAEKELKLNSAVSANSAVKKFGTEIVLHKENCLPHISLAMGCIDERDILSIEKVLTAVAERCMMGELKIIGIHTSTNSRGETVSAFEVEKTRELQSLHEKVMEKVQPYFSSVVTADMIYGGEEVAETTLEWIKSYREKAGFAKFFPHITIGYGEAEEQEFLIKFSALKLALCHLGNHCTCRKILSSIDLRS